MALLGVDLSTLYFIDGALAADGYGREVNLRYGFPSGADRGEDGVVLPVVVSLKPKEN